LHVLRHRSLIAVSKISGEPLAQDQPGAMEPRARPNDREPRGLGDLFVGEPLGVLKSTTAHRIAGINARS
jgi:hypothetical protein